MKDFEQASERVVAGIERKTLVDQNEKIVNYFYLDCSSS
jgi:hypothetical protein